MNYIALHFIFYNFKAILVCLLTLYMNCKFSIYRRFSVAQYEENTRKKIIEYADIIYLIYADISLLVLCNDVLYTTSVTKFCYN